MKSSFRAKVLGLTRKIPRGKVSTYKAIAEALNTRAYRAVGQALRSNDKPVVIPCHRVVGSDGRIGGYSGQTTGKAIKRKIMLLEKEGVKVSKGRIQDFEKKFYEF